MTGTTNTPVRVLLVDDDPLVRSGLRMMLTGDQTITIVGEAADGTEVPAAVEEHRPDVVLMDVRMPGVDGIAATARLRAGEVATPQVLVLTTFDADTTVVEALRAGAAGYLLKHTDPERIVEAVQRAATGEPVLSPSVTRTLMDHVVGSGTTVERTSRRDRARARLALLTDREREVAEAVTAGLSNGEIADRLYMSMGTVKAHVSNALTKLDLTGRVQLALIAHDAAEDVP
ncbi:DNA-binding response regulator [Nocardiopsis kunsanensis]|uniref:DNA-binding response regulator n=1 Tax=Nocardiopsis kunsanensis TaxID=141693 RepID=A0A919CJ40_9ACTN|nr:response regulator transcription factor [Nocardiopsis kunsanensis]GHD29994.1 DNA-binding response regulator [Nocardiopsis kunsanensis]